MYVDQSIMKCGTGNDRKKVYHHKPIPGDTKMLIYQLEKSQRSDYQ